MILYCIIFLVLYCSAVYFVENTETGEKIYNKIFKD